MSILSSFSCSRTIGIALGIAILLPVSMQAQISSPSNAGGNAGNNSSGSTSTSISTSNFAPIPIVPVAPGVTITNSNTVTTVTASPLIVTAVTTAVNTSVPPNSTLSPVVTATVPSIPDLNSGSMVDVLLEPQSGPSQTPNTVSQLEDGVATVISQGQSLTVSTLTASSLGRITPTETGLTVTIANQEVMLITPAENITAMSQFAAIAIVVGLTPTSLAIGAGLVNTGASPLQIARLMVGLQGLANSTELTSLSTGIDAFNSLVQGSSDSTLQSLASQNVFLAARSTLMAARTAIGS